MLSIENAKECAKHFKMNFIERTYIIHTLNNREIVLKSEPKQFPHLIGINKSNYTKYGYKGKDIFRLLISKDGYLPKNIIPNRIDIKSKKGRKILNFINMNSDLFSSPYTLCIIYNPEKNHYKLNNVNYLFTNFKSGFSSGWIYNKSKKSCESTSWIDESNGNWKQKQKYYNAQTIELIDSVEIYDLNNKLLKFQRVNRKFYHYLLIKLICVINKNKLVIQS